MKTWVKVLLAACILFIGSIGVIAIAFPAHLPAIRTTLTNVFGGIYAGLRDVGLNLWASMEPVVMPHLFPVFLISIFLSGIFGMYFGHKITTKMQNFIGIQWRRQANTVSGGTVPLTIGAGGEATQLAAGTPSASALLGVSEPKKEND